MRGAIGGPRLLLKRLREVMAEPVGAIGAQERLDRIVALIAANMVAEVCSVYVLRADDFLELYATEGLNRTAVHKTGLRIGSGLVGRIAEEARTLNLADAQSHPAFAYLPETGEEIYKAFLGVPILRAGRTLGVLVVQNRAHRTYNEDEVEALQTTAMILAEVIAGGELERLSHPDTKLDLRRPMNLEGRAIAEGIGLGHVVLHEPRVVVTEMFAEDTERELGRLDAALVKLRLSLDSMLERGEAAGLGDHREVLEAYRMFAHDRGWVRRMQEALRNGLTAEAAVEKVQSDTRARMLRSTDPYLRERLHDLDDLANRLLRELMGRPHGPVADRLPRDAIIVARSMGAADLLDYERDHLRGLILEEGGPTSHVAIIARAFGIPAVTQVAGVVSLAEAGDAVIADGETGLVHLRPPVDVEEAYAEKVRFRARRQAQYRRLKRLPATSRDGHEITLNLNAGLLVDLPHLEESGAVGIGLFRTEILFMVAPMLPKVTDQRALYTQVLEAAGDRPVVFRTLDIGGDKVLPYLHAEQEENPAMGWRAIRIGLDRPALLRVQLRALLQAAAGKDLRIMFPMVSAVSEFDAARALLDREVKYLRRHAHALPETIRIGVMLEVPSLLMEFDELLPRVDFISVGSNDLFQFMYAVDRGNTRVSQRFDTLSLSFLRVMKKIIDEAGEAHVPVSVCGEMAGRPLEAMALVALGYRNLSMSPSAVGPVKAMIRALDIGRLRARLISRLEPGRPTLDFRAFLKAYAAEQEVPV